MPLQDISIVNITLQGPGVTRAGFGTPLFITDEKYFSQRVVTITSVNGIPETIPTDSITYAAILSFFSQTPDPQQLKVGRSINDTTVVGFDETLASGVTVDLAVQTPKGNVTANHVTAAPSETNTTISAGILSDLETKLEALGYAAGEVGAGGTIFDLTSGASGLTVLESDLNESMGFDTDTSNNVLTYTFSEDSPNANKAAADIAEIESVDNGFYFVTSQDHSVDYVLEMAAAVEAREKLYFVSTDVSDTVNLPETTDPVDVDDIAHLLQDNNYFRTIHLWQQDADIDFPEANFIAHRAPFDPGSVTWSNLNIAGVGVSRDPTTGKVLSATQLNNLSDKNSNFVQDVGGLPIFREGKSAAGEWIDNLRGRDWLTARLREDLTDLLISQRGSKVPYTDAGIDQVRSVMQTRLNDAVNVGFLDSFTIDLPNASDILTADKQARVLRNAKFTGVLAGAIHMTEISGELIL